MDKFWNKLLTRSSLENPSTSLVEFFTGSPSASGVSVNSQTTLGLPAIWRGVRLISSVKASLPLSVYKTTPNGREKHSEHSINRLLKKPNPFMTGYSFREINMFNVHFHRNAYALISKREKTVPSELLPYHPSQVQPVIRNGRLYYVFTSEGKQEVVDSVNVLHFKGLGSDGIEGKDIVTLLKENLGLGIAQQKNAADFYGSYSKLKFAVTTAGALGVKGVANLRKSWKKVHGGANGEDVAFLDAGMDIKQITATPEESQNVQSRKFSITDVSRILGIPPPLLYDLERATFSNISELIQSFVKFDLVPWLVNIEAEYNDKLFKESEKDMYFTKHNVEGLLRGDLKTRTEAYQKMIWSGLMSPNEAREKEDMNPYEGGNQKYITQNLMPVGDGIEDRLLKIEKALNGRLKETV